MMIIGKTAAAPIGSNYDRDAVALKNNRLNKEYVCVRQLISILTNDNSEKLIVEKLKGKNLSSLLYNAKIIDNSKNMATNKRILGCVIRAIEKEKHLMRRKEIETSWSRKFLSSFNCLHPIRSEVAVFRDYRDVRRLKKRNQGIAKSGKKSVRASVKPRSKRSDVTSIFTTRMGSERFSNFGSVFKQPAYCKTEKAYTCVFKTVMPSYETVFPLDLSYVQTKSIEIVPFADKNVVCPPERVTSSTQTSEVDSVFTVTATQVDSSALASKLRNLFDAAVSEPTDGSVSLKNFARYVDSTVSPSTEITPYLKYPLKYPMKSSRDTVDPDMSYREASELSLTSEGSGYELVGLGEKESQNSTSSSEREQKPKEIQETHLLRQDQTKQPGVVYESLKNSRDDYSKIGACIIRRLNASIQGNRTENAAQNSIVPELILKCTELFENATDDDEPADSTRDPRFTTFQKPADRDANDFCFPVQENSCSSKGKLFGVSENSLKGALQCKEVRAGKNPTPELKSALEEFAAENSTQTPALSVHSLLEELRDKMSQPKNPKDPPAEEEEDIKPTAVNLTIEPMILNVEPSESQTLTEPSAEILLEQSKTQEFTTPAPPPSMVSSGIEPRFDIVVNSFVETPASNGLILHAFHSTEKRAVQNEASYESHDMLRYAQEKTKDKRDVNSRPGHKKGKTKKAKPAKKGNLESSRSCKVM